MNAKSAVQTVIAIFLVSSLLWPVVKYISNKYSGIEPVKVSLYDESYCPACRQFVKDQLGPAWRDLHDIMQVEVVAYGWAEETPLDTGYNFTCQHGPDECTGNMILECAKEHISRQGVFIKLTVCFMSEESEPLPPPFVVARKCAHKVGAKQEWPAIKRCATSLEGEQLLHEAGVKFHSLKDPEPTWVPWILINGKQNDKAEEDLKSVVCSTYQGQPPAICPSILAKEDLPSTTLSPNDLNNQSSVV
ncbi:gamma-interferon-inducible lysosomal thiol reductase-like [Palaemon carinicauda]|uniref:gamma-interferon-inducible lysosomal thiol reductase-like n=1 Tax=Palaemon carinicauda TaxID=392227 RepID=UPI0035B6454A